MAYCNTDIQLITLIVKEIFCTIMIHRKQWCLLLNRELLLYPPVALESAGINHQ